MPLHYTAAQARFRFGRYAMRAGPLGGGGGVPGGKRVGPSEAGDLRKEFNATRCSHYARPRDGLRCLTAVSWGTASAGRPARPGSARKLKAAAGRPPIQKKRGGGSPMPLRMSASLPQRLSSKRHVKFCFHFCE